LAVERSLLAGRGKVTLDEGGVKGRVGDLRGHADQRGAQGRLSRRERGWS